MKAIFSMTIIALFSMLLAGCWFYSRNDPVAGCQKTTYGIAIASTSTENCPPPPADAAPQSPSVAPPIPPPATP
jgi:hypothetical protein